MNQFGYPFDPEFLPVTNAHPIIGLVHRHPGAARPLFDLELNAMDDWDMQQRLHFAYRAVFVSNPTVTATYHRSTARTCMTIVPPTVFLEAYHRITARWRHYWRPNPRIERLQRMVCDHYLAQHRKGEINDLDTYERFLERLKTLADNIEPTP